MKALKIVLVLVVLGVILYLVYTKLIKKDNKIEECNAMKDIYGIVPGQTFGTAPQDVIDKWKSQRCFM